MPEPIVGRTHPKPKCRLFGRDHVWSYFPYVKGRLACSVCGVEDDEAWWTDSGYIGPDEPVYADIDTPGWLLRGKPGLDGYFAAQNGRGSDDA